MSYSSVDASLSDGQPLYFYEFNANNTYYRYTNLRNEQILNTLTYYPESIKHSAIKQDPELSKNKLNVTLPITASIASIFDGSPPEYTINFTLFRKHESDAEAIVAWKGRVSAVGYEGNQLELKCMPISETIKRPGLRLRYQKSCPHSLYDSSCGVDKTNFQTSTTATAVNGYVVTVPDAALQPDKYYEGGMIRDFDGKYRFIRRHAGDQLTLIKPVTDWAESISTNGSLAVVIYAGCDRTRQTCNDRFTNLQNYLGFDWIPAINPFGGSSIL